MKNSFKNTDGIFVPRQNQPQARRTLDSILVPSDTVGVSARHPMEVSPRGMPPVLEQDKREMLASKPQTPPELKPIDLDLSLPDSQKPKKKRTLWRPGKKFWLSLVVLIVIGLLAGAGYFAYKLFVASGNIFKGGGQSLLGGTGIDISKLQHEGDGRINILLAATSEDDPNHPGGTLTDSVMIASIDPINKGATLISIPRDLWVQIPNCDMYYREKINAVYQCGEEGNFKEQGFPDGGIGLLQKVVQNLSGIHINYYAKINYTAFRQAVDAVDGVDVTIDSSDPRGIYDPNFDWICRYKCTKVKWPNGVAHLDGEHALYLARSRNSAGGYGMPRGDFDRTEYQRKMLIALKDKAASMQTLSNPLKLSNLIDSIGNNITTNFSRDDMMRLYTVAKDIPADKIKSVGLADGEDAVLTTGNAGGASIVQPKAGLFAYDALQLLVRRQSIDPYIISEAPTIALYNGTATAGLATKQKDLLTSYGYTVVVIGDAPTKDYAKTVFNDATKNKKPVTRQYLQNRYKTTAISTDLPEGIAPTYETAEKDAEGNPKPPKTADYVIILGADTK